MAFNEHACAIHSACMIGGRQRAHAHRFPYENVGAVPATGAGGGATRAANSRAIRTALPQARLLQPQRLHNILSFNLYTPMTAYASPLI